MDRFPPLCSTVLKELLLKVRGKDAVLPQDIITDSRKLADNCLFAAVPGSRVDGHVFIPEAEKKASVIVHCCELERYLPGITYYLVRDAASAAALLYRAKYGEPDSSLSLFGVTGTNGKTTTAFILKHLLNDCGLLSTVTFFDGKEEVPATHTTPDPEKLFSMLGRMRDNHLSAAALELSSHALHQNRAKGAVFRAAIFTNLTGDHLDYHHDMESYYQAKKSFFTGLLSKDGIAVINTDDPAGLRLAQELQGLRRVTTFGTAPHADWQIRELNCKKDGMSFELCSREKSYPVSTNLTGAYNAFNLAGAILAVLDHGVSFEEIAFKLQQKITVPGRLQFLSSPRGGSFVVDFAHTDDALKNVLETLRPLTEKRLICVFGAGGDRDKSKRPRMGRAASAADLLIVTSDNPRSEDPEKIIDEIVTGIPAGSVYEICPDRKAAIRRAFELAEKGDVVLVAGKGHENYQEINGVKHAFSDLQVISDCFEGIHE